MNDSIVSRNGHSVDGRVKSRGNVSQVRIPCLLDGHETNNRTDEGKKNNEPVLEAFEQWIGKDNCKIRVDGSYENLIDLVFEFLHDQDMLKSKGKDLAHRYWEKYVKEK